MRQTCVAILFLVSAALCQAGNLRTFTILNATNPTEPGGLLNGSDPYWGTFTIDESSFQIASFDLFLGPQAVPYSGLPCPPCSFTFNQPLLEINSAKLNSLSSLSVGPVLGGPVPVDLVTLLFSGTGTLSPDATPGAPNPAALYGITLILDFYQPPADFVGGYVAEATSQLRLFTADVAPFPFLSGVNQSDTRFTAIAIDPQVAASIPEPGTWTLAGMALGIICAAGRVRVAAGGSAAGPGTPPLERGSEACFVP